MIPAKKPAGAPPKFGDVAGMCERVDRLGNVEATVARIEKKLDDLVRMMTPLFANPSIRQAIGAAITSQSMRVRQ
jgi:hypothetical protein